jgi:uncharacterized protein DUF4333
MRARAVIVISCLALIGGACTRERTLDVGGLESTLQSQLQDRESQTITSVDCPDEIKVEQDATFECIATGEDTTWTIQVVQQDDQGNVIWKIADAKV